MSDSADNVANLINTEHHYFRWLLSSSERDYLVRNNGEQIKIETLKGKKLGLYFSASWHGPCQRFTPALVEAYKELSAKGDFEVILIPNYEENDEFFKKYFYKMPWLAIPFSDTEACERLFRKFRVFGILMPHLVILGEDGKVLSDNGVEIVHRYGAITPEKIQKLKDEEEAARREQSLKTILVSRSCNFVISNDGKEVPVSKLEGKIVGLYFSSFESSSLFTPELAEVYKNLKDEGRSFEIVYISPDIDKDFFKNGYTNMPWFYLPFGDTNFKKLFWYFELSNLPSLVIIGEDGKTVNRNVVDAIYKHGFRAYPFTPQKFAELIEMENAETLESFFISGDRNFLIKKYESEVKQIHVSDLAGKNILLYFVAQWISTCHSFLDILLTVYKEIKAMDDAFEVVFFSSDSDEDTFNEVFLKMPWPALPFGDSRIEPLCCRLQVGYSPTLLAIDPSGKIVTRREVSNLVLTVGAKAYPFTKEQLEEMEEEYKKMAYGLPEKLKSALHEEHELVLERESFGYICDWCSNEGEVWSYCCDECDLSFHHSCASGTKNDAKQERGPQELGKYA